MQTTINIRDSVVELYRQHPSWNQVRIGKELNISPQYVWAILHAAGEKIARGHHTRTMAVALRQEHPDWTVKAIGLQVGVQDVRVREILKSEGLPIVPVATIAPESDTTCRICGIKAVLGDGLCVTCWDKRV